MKGLGVATAGFIALAAFAGAATYQSMSKGGLAARGESASASVAGKPAARGGNASASPSAVAADGRQGTFIVVFKEQPLASYKGSVGGPAAPERRLDKRGKLRLDTQGAAALNYVRYLQGRQQMIEGDLQRSLGRSLAVRDRMQHAINAIVTDMTAAEAKAVRRNANVLLVEAYKEYALDTDTGPALIGAPAVWSGAAATTPYQGEGTVLGIIDSGINFGSPSFAEVGPVDGYAHVNPRGDGNYLGTCAAGGVDAGRCNDKLIGGYDFVCNAPANQCGLTNIREEPGFGDTNGHGSHTASTAGGNRRSVNYRGNLRNISGVAPRANIVAYDVCYTNTATGQGLCPNVSTLAAINQTVADGIIDVINYSIGGGTSPWTEAGSLAFLNAVEAGIYVAASAGNSGPGPNTMGHLQPWVSSTAAAQHGRSDFVFSLMVTGPGTVPAPLQAIVINEGSGGAAHTAAIPGTTPLRVSPNIDATNDGCNAGTPYPAGTFAGAIAVVRRGTCAFSEKVNNAATAGAIAVVIANNAAGGIIPSVPGTTIRAFGMTQADGNAVRDFVVANPTATAGINFPAAILTNTPDALAAFSSRGPAASFDLVKPNVTAPGVSVLAAYAGTTIDPSFNPLIDIISGTSMASPHQAGSAALLRQARPTWTVPEIMSALAMTADQTVLLEDQTTPANAFAAGSGRLRVDRAVNAGLVLDESAGDYRNANPGTGGDVSKLNLASMAKRSCVQSCQFKRLFRSTQPNAQSYNVSLQGLTGTATLTAGLSRKFLTLQVNIDSSAIPADGVWRFGTVVLTPIGSTLPTLRLPVAVSVPAPPPPATPIQNGVPVTGLSGATGSVAYYSIVVPAGRTSLAVTTSGGTGDADLDVGPVQLGPYVCSSGGATNAETCTINNPAAGTWYIRISGFAAYTGMTLTATYSP